MYSVFLNSKNIEECYIQLHIVHIMLLTSHERPHLLHCMYVVFPLHWNKESVIINGSTEQMYNLLREISFSLLWPFWAMSNCVWSISKDLFLLHLCWPQWSGLMVRSISHQWYSIGYHLSTVWFYQVISLHLKLQSLKFIVANGIKADTRIDLHTNLKQTNMWIKFFSKLKIILLFICVHARWEIMQLNMLMNYSWVLVAFPAKS